MGKPKIDIATAFKTSDPRELPAYSIPDASHYLCIPKATIRSWTLGTSYSSGGEKKRFQPVIVPPRNSNLLSFFNLAEAHVLRALRTGHGITLPKVRRALRYVTKRFGWNRPLIHRGFMTDGVNLFVDQLNALIDVSAGGQLVLRELISEHLQRLEWEDDLVVRVYPFTRSSLANSPKLVFIDPRISFGRPILRHSGVATAVIAQRYKAGESMESLANDYGCPQEEIEEGVRCELQLNSAA